MLEPDSSRPRCIQKIDLLFVSIVVIVGVCIHLYSTSRWGIGLGSDSFNYLNVAENIGNGKGLVTDIPNGKARPVTVWPPLYSLFLSVGAFFGDVLVWARLTHALLFGITTATVYSMTRWAGGSVVSSLLGASIAICGSNALNQFSTLLSEALFLPLELIGIWALAIWASSRDRKYLWLSALLFGACTMTRYAGQGSALVLSLVVFIYSRGDKPWRTALKFLLLSQVVTVAWLMRNIYVSDSMVARSFAYQGIRLGWIFDLWRLATIWLWPENWSRWIRHPATLLLFAAAVVLIVKRIRLVECSRLKSVSIVGTVWVLGYVSLLFSTEFFIGRTQDLDSRMMLPVMYPAIILLGISIPTKAFKNRLLLALSIGYILGSLCRVGLVAKEVRDHGIAFASSTWQTSELVRRAKLLPAGTKVASNKHLPSEYYLGRVCYSLPTLEENSAKNLDIGKLSDFQEQVGSGDYYVLLFSDKWAWDASEESLSEALNLHVVEKYPDGVLLYYAGK